MATSYILRIHAPQENHFLLLPDAELIFADLLGDIDRVTVAGYITPNWHVQQFPGGDDPDIRNLSERHIGSRQAVFHEMVSTIAIDETLGYCAPVVREYIRASMFGDSVDKQLAFIQEMMPHLVKESASKVDTPQYPYFNLSTLADIAEGWKCDNAPFFDDICKMFWPLQNHAYGSGPIAYLTGWVTW